uniref:UBL3-like ubiquitin domain-containing protein n=1 Tax=Oryza meridionalis TaxID=40149 RepID=A0A0E0DZA3_9ORYZ
MAGSGGMEAVEVRFRLDDGSDIGPSMHDQATTVTALKEFVLARWPQGKEIAPRTVNDVTIINAGQMFVDDIRKNNFVIFIFEAAAESTTTRADQMWMRNIVTSMPAATCTLVPKFTAITSSF